MEDKNGKNQQRADIPELTGLDALGLELADSRREAIDGRRMTGIEHDWVEDEEFYLGIDSANRHEFENRPTKPSDGVSWSTDDVKEERTTKSTAFINITRPYVDAAAARMGDMLLSSNDSFFGLEPTPIPEVDDRKTSEALITIADDMPPVTEKDLVQAIYGVAKEYADRGKKRIDDWFREDKWSGKGRRILHDAAKLGTGIIKGPVPIKRRRVKWNWDQAGRQLKKEVSYEIQPGSKWVDPYNAFPDPQCGEDIQDGNYFWERDYLTARRVKELRDKPELGYIPEQIDACLQEGPISALAEWHPFRQDNYPIPNKHGLYEIWYYTGMVETEKLRDAGVDTSEFGDVDEISAVVTMINHRVVKVLENHLDDGSFPYDFMVWQRRPGSPWGIGVARQMRVSQRQLNAANRNMMDNAALSAGPQIIINTDLIEPFDGDWELVPRKVWVTKRGADQMADIGYAFKVVTIETRQPELMNIIQFALRMAEEATGLPMILQGQMGQKAPDTVGGMVMLQNNASSVLRRLAKQWDDSIAIPHVTRYYHWLMEYGPDREKGDYQVVAKGSTTLVERDLQNQELALVVEMALNPAYGIDPEKAGREFIKSRHFDPSDFEVDEEKKQQQAQQPPDPKVQAQMIQAQDNEAERQHESAENEAQRVTDIKEKLMDINSDHQLFNAERQLKRRTGSGI